MAEVVDDGLGVELVGLEQESRITMRTKSNRRPDDAIPRRVDDRQHAGHIARHRLRRGGRRRLRRAALEAEADGGHAAELDERASIHGGMIAHRFAGSAGSQVQQVHRFQQVRWFAGSRDVDCRTEPSNPEPVEPGTCRTCEPENLGPRHNYPRHAHDRFVHRKVVDSRARPLAGCHGVDRLCRRGHRRLLSIASRRHGPRDRVSPVCLSGAGAGPGSHRDHADAGESQPARSPRRSTPGKDARPIGRPRMPPTTCSSSRSWPRR